MKKKKDEFYYKNLNQCAGYACRAAEVLQETLKEFDQTALQEKMEQVHELEQQGDTKRHKMMAVTTSFHSRVWLLCTAPQTQI